MILNTDFTSTAVIDMALVSIKVMYTKVSQRVKN